MRGFGAPHPSDRTLCNACAAPRGPDLAMGGAAAPPLPFQVFSQHCPEGFRLYLIPAYLRGSCCAPSSPGSSPRCSQPLGTVLLLAPSPALPHHLSHPSPFPAPPATGSSGLCSPCPYWSDWALLPPCPCCWHGSYPALISRRRGCTREHLSGAGDSRGPQDRGSPH